MLNVRFDGKDIGERELRFEEMWLYSLVEGKAGGVMQIRAWNYATRHTALNRTFSELRSGLSIVK